MEDAINISNSSDIQVLNNYLDSNAGLGKPSGCGILVEGGSNIVISGNTMLNQYFPSTGGCGLGVAHGQNVLVTGNSADGYGNVGFYVWGTAACSDITLEDNIAGTRPDGSSNPFWNGGGCSNVSLSGNSWE